MIQIFISFTTSFADGFTAGQEKLEAFRPAKGIGIFKQF